MLSFVYCCRIGENNKGVENKVLDTVNAMSKITKVSNSLIVKKNGLFGHLILAFKLFTLKENIILLRATPFTMFLMFPGLLFQRLLNKKIIIDIPTPFVNVIQEVNGSKSNIINKTFKILMMYMTLPITLYPANRILQYSTESFWFSLGIKNKILQVGNGINVKDTLFRERKPAIDNHEIHVTGIATLAYWHGYDRFLHSLNKYKMNNPEYSIIFHIVGDGEEKIKLEKLAQKLMLENNVIFYGLKYNDELIDIFNKTHIGLCSLSLYKINLNVASVLKAREYAARGLPFILGCKDFDFDSKLEFIHQCENNDSIIDLNSIVEWYLNLDKKYQDFRFIRDYALDNVDFDIKVKKEILNFKSQNI